jgi:tetratricopeptide (TPR) repeat protein
MDPTTLLGLAVLALALIGIDTIHHAGSIVVEVSSPPQIAGESIDQQSLEAAFDDQLYAVANTPSVIEPPEIRTSRDQGVGMEVAQAFNAKELGYALQTAAGYAPDRLRLALYLEHGELRGLITGRTRAVGSFYQVMVPYKDETELAFVRRCALWSASEIAPYMTALYLMQKHAADRDFTDVLALIDHVMAELPPTPVSFDRAAFDNLHGIVLLFQNDPQHAQQLFDQAVAEYPANPVSEINAAFADLQLDHNQQAYDRMARFVRDNPPANKVLLETAYMTWAAAAMAEHRLDEADKLLAQACAIYPANSSAFDLWGELAALRGDKAAAAAHHRQAMINSQAFENYGEVATLYFHLAWKDNQPVTLNKFANPSIVRFH